MMPVRFRRAGPRCPFSSVAGGAGAGLDVIHHVGIVSHFAVDVVERPPADGAHGSSAGPLQNAGITEKVPAPAHGSLVMNAVLADWAH